MSVPVAHLAARDGHEADDFASLDERDEEAGREMMVLAHALRHLLLGRVVHCDGLLLPEGPPPRRVLRERRIGVEFFQRAVRPDRVAIEEVGSRREKVHALDGKRGFRGLEDHADELVQLSNPRQRE